MNYRFVKKPVIIEAFRMTLERRRDNSEWPEWLNAGWNKEKDEVGSVYPILFDSNQELSSNKEIKREDDRLAIRTLEGVHEVSWDDWIIRGVAGELYPCKPDIFEQTYEEVDQDGT